MQSDGASSARAKPVTQYRGAIQWLAHNDDNAWLRCAYSVPPVAVRLLASLFDRPIERVVRDLIRETRGTTCNRNTN